MFETLKKSIKHVMDNQEESTRAMHWLTDIYIIEARIHVAIIIVTYCSRVVDIVFLTSLLQKAMMMRWRHTHSSTTDLKQEKTHPNS